jgi:hypothetical protein
MRRERLDRRWELRGYSPGEEPNSLRSLLSRLPAEAIPRPTKPDEKAALIALAGKSPREETENRESNCERAKG